MPPSVRPRSNNLQCPFIKVGGVMASALKPHLGETGSCRRFEQRALAAAGGAGELRRTEAGPKFLFTADALIKRGVGCIHPPAHRAPHPPSATFPSLLSSRNRMKKVALRSRAGGRAGRWHPVLKVIGEPISGRMFYSVRSFCFRSRLALGIPPALFGCFSVVLKSQNPAIGMKEGV